MKVSKRTLLLSAAAAGVLPAQLAATASPASAPKVEPFPMEAVTLLPSPWATSVATNATYLKSLEPDRLLHNFRVSAGLPPRGKVYGGWESLGIAGHSLGHYLSACSLMYAQTRDEDFKRRIAYTVGDMATIQTAHGDGYIGGTTVDRGGKTVDGKVIFEELRAHDVRSQGFDLNGGWVPLYTWHKVHAGLLDAHKLAGNAQALDVAVKMSDYLIGVMGGLSDSEMQTALAAEHGGLNESLAETYVRTGQKRFLDLSQRIYHKAILDPLSQGRDELAGRHANTQIPKLIGLARLAEITGKDSYHRTAAFFWETVVNHHSYVIGGNSDGEHFAAPGKLSDHITDKTCEACNSYNMLKLTRHLYQAAPDAKWFDVYERVHLNHILSHQHPETGHFVYFMPLSPNSQRVYSTDTNSFWCCVGSGMESHAKHGDSIWWRSGSTVFLNLFIPSEVRWTAKATTLRLEGAFPEAETLTLHVDPAKATEFEIAVRLPAWCEAPAIAINGVAQPILPRDGYARLMRRWKKGDTVTLTLPQSLRVETIPDNAQKIAYLKGPMVMAADMGPAQGETPREPVLVGDDPAALVTTDFKVAARPASLKLKPFYAQYDRRSTVYFPMFSAEQWSREEAAFTAAEAAQSAIRARTIDFIQLGEQQPETDHHFATDLGEPTSRNGRAGRWIMWSSDKSFSFDLAIDPASTVLQATYWGEERDKRFDILIDGQLLKNETLDLAPQPGFRTVDYPLPGPLTAGKSQVRVTFMTRGSTLEVFSVRAVRPEAQQKA